MKVQVDGDVLCYRAGFAAEHNLYHVHWMEDGVERSTSFDGAKGYKTWQAANPGLAHWVDNETHVEPVEASIFNIHSILKSIAEELQVNKDADLIVYLSGPTNYRNGIATIKPYKGNRDPTKKPVHAAAIKELLRNRYGAITTDGIEADDAMAIAHCASAYNESIIATIDKDLNTIPGLHYNFVTKESYNVDEREAKLNFWRQMITGDTVDNIPGVPGAGPAKAKKWLGAYEELGSCTLELLDLRCYEVVQPLYVQGYGDKADEVLLEMGRLLWIRRKPDEWWTPPTGELSAVSE
jgi:hypothetical protein